MTADSAPIPLDDPFSNAAWAQGQRRIDYEKCKRVERDGIPTVWPKDLAL